MSLQFYHYVHTIDHKLGFQEVLAETDDVDNCSGIVAMTLWGQWTYAMYALLFHLPSILISNDVSPTATAMVAAPILKLCDP